MIAEIPAGQANNTIFYLAIICCDLIQCSRPYSNYDVQINTTRSLARIYTKLCVLLMSVSHLRTDFARHFIRYCISCLLSPGPEVIKLFSCSTQLSTKLQLLKYRKMKKFLALSISDVVFIMLINVKMPTIVDKYRAQLS